jgi:hypothetical protein
MLSAQSLRRRRAPLRVFTWMLDSGAFSEVSQYGGFRSSPWAYAMEIAWWSRYGTLTAAVSQDYMCEDWILERTGLTVADHQRLTLERYDALVALAPCRPNGTPVYVLPVLQGFQPDEYRTHVLAYGSRLAPEAWVGVGSVCKRNGRPEAVVAVLDAILDVRPDLRLHGFGLKLTALRDPRIRARLHSSDSMAWSFAARKQGRDQHDWREARAYVDRVAELVRHNAHKEVATP